MDAIALNMPIHEKQTLKLYVTITSNGAPVEKDAFDVYAASVQGSISNPFTVKTTETDGQWLITAPGKQNATSTAWQYQIFAHNKETCHEWAILSGTITQADRLADISCVKYAIPEYAVTVDIITGAMAVKPNYSGEDTPTANCVETMLAGENTWTGENTFTAGLKKAKSVTLTNETVLNKEEAQGLFLGVNHITLAAHFSFSEKGKIMKMLAKESGYDNAMKHTADTTIHITAAERETWNGKADSADLTEHTSDTAAHITADERTKWNAAAENAGGGSSEPKSKNWIVFGVGLTDSMAPKDGATLEKDGVTYTWEIPTNISTVVGSCFVRIICSEEVGVQEALYAAKNLGTGYQAAVQELGVFPIYY